MRYIFRCDEHGAFEVDAPMSQGPGKIRPCPVCREDSVRVFQAVPDIWHCQGAHKTDYSKTGDKLEELNKSWSKHFNEAPPPPAKDIKTNSSDIQ